MVQLFRLWFYSSNKAREMIILSPSFYRDDIEVQGDLVNYCGLSHRIWSMILHWVQFSHSVVSDSLRPHEPQHTRPPCPSPTAGVYPNPCPLGWWFHPTISSSVVPFSSCLQSFWTSGSFQMSQFFPSGGQVLDASASVLPMNIQDWFPLGWTVCISLQSKGLSRVFSNTTIQNHQFFTAQLSS